jgi:hypothetical protein
MDEASPIYRETGAPEVSDDVVETEDIHVHYGPVGGVGVDPAPLLARIRSLLTEREELREALRRIEAEVEAAIAGQGSGWSTGKVLSIARSVLSSKETRGSVPDQAVPGAESVAATYDGAGVDPDMTIRSGGNIRKRFSEGMTVEKAPLTDPPSSRETTDAPKKPTRTALRQGGGQSGGTPIPNIVRETTDSHDDALEWNSELNQGATTEGTSE